ncbi:MAG: DegT/DnrJ/EryC1/StrS family aminotransferase [Rhodospirillaceae bacterium]|nr:MAG: DegT/DnrJ/EryC1/StrS family aminotransferase [Rhodospirillaceae bacterium]
MTSAPALTPVPPIRIDFSPEDRAWITERISEVLANGRLTLGAYGEDFEKRFAAMTGAKHAVAVSSGTSSLEIMLRVADVRDKDVLVPANTFIATASAVIAAGGRPVLMDTDGATLSTTAAEIERRITPKTVGVMIVHIAGFVTDEMPAIVDLLKRKGLWLMEDAAHAHASTLNGKHAGTFGWAGSFSFYPTKVMTSAEGGMIITDDDHLASEARIYRDQGKASFLQNSHIRMGSNWRMSEPHAIIGLRHLHNLPAMIAARRRIAARYDVALTGPNNGVRPLLPPKGCAANYYKYVVMLPEGCDRAALKAWLRDTHGVQCSGEVYEFPLHRHPVLTHLDPGDLRGAEIACNRQMCLPIFASMTDDEADRVIAALTSARTAGRV